MLRMCLSNGESIAERQLSNSREEAGQHLGAMVIRYMPSKLDLHALQ